MQKDCCKQEKEQERVYQFVSGDILMQWEICGNESRVVKVGKVREECNG